MIAAQSKITSIKKSTQLLADKASLISTTSSTHPTAAYPTEK